VKQNMCNKQKIDELMRHARVYTHYKLS